MHFMHLYLQQFQIDRITTWQAALEKLCDFKSLVVHVCRETSLVNVLQCLNNVERSSNISLLRRPKSDNTGKILLPVDWSLAQYRMQIKHFEALTRTNPSMCLQPEWEQCSSVVDYSIFVPGTGLVSTFHILIQI